MNTPETLSPNDQARLHAAAEWWERLRSEPALELSAEFQRWVSDAAHERAFQAVQDTQAALQHFSASHRILDMRQQALKSLKEGRTYRHPYRRVGLIAAGFLVMAVAGGGFLYQNVFSGQTFRTESGERRVVALSDGSRISLDSDTELNANYSGKDREITLRKGRARFDVAHDVTRPFTVTAGDETVVAVGTSFNVERLGPKVVVTLIQGRVSVRRRMQDSFLSADHGRISAVTLSAGEQIAAQEGTAPVVKAANLDAATAWEAGHLVFRGEPLGDAVAQVNRYTENPIVVDQSAATIPVSGVFNAGDVTSFVSAITSYFPVEATTGTDHEIRLQKKPT